ncbi:MAG: kinase [Proteobacteria bacterium]|nr:kinase [Pseudomonadota bacterium]
MQKIALDQFLTEHQLPLHYSHTIENWFSPIAAKIFKQQQQTDKILVLGINGAQGSGKSTLAKLLVQIFDQDFALTAVALSLDDFYYTGQERKHLAQTLHPLLNTRGVPGTHDIPLAIKIVQRLSAEEGICHIPRFNKVTDDRYAQAEWTVVSGHVDIIIVEGWCLGAQAQHPDELVIPINDLEAKEDSEQIWRSYVNDQLKLHYPALFSYIDVWVMLKAPSFDCIYQWRLEQEMKLRSTIAQQPRSERQNQNLMTEKDIVRFIKFYQRITEHMLKTLPEKVDYLFEMNQQREIQNLIDNTNSN